MNQMKSSIRKLLLLLAAICCAEIAWTWHPWVGALLLPMVYWAANPRPWERVWARALVTGVVCFSTSAFCGNSEAKSALESDPQGWQDIQPSMDRKDWTRVAIPPTNKLGRAQWHVEQGPPRILVCDGDGGHEMLRYDKELGDCVVHVEFRFVPVSEGKQDYNSGVFIRNSADGAIWHQAQLTMDGGYWFGNSPVNGEPKRFKLQPKERRMKPAGEWNTIEATARGRTLSIWFNGAVTCTYANCDFPQGYIALESEGYAIEFRNVKLKTMGGL